MKIKSLLKSTENWNGGGGGGGGEDFKPQLLRDQIGGMWNWSSNTGLGCIKPPQTKKGKKRRKEISIKKKEVMCSQCFRNIFITNYRW